MKIDTATSYGYDIAGGFRGPDSDTEDAMPAKMLSVAVVRYLAGVSLLCQGFSQCPEDARRTWKMYSPEVQGRIRKFFNEEHHFRRHVELAFEALAYSGIGDASEHLDWLSAEVFQTKEPPHESQP